MVQKPEAVVFDMDGVLINSHPAHLAAWREFLLSVEVTPSEHDLDFILEGRTRSEILAKFLGHLSDEELQVFGRRKDEMFRRIETKIPPMPGALSLVNLLSDHKVKLAVATSASEIRTFATVERFGLGGRFDAIVTAADVAAGKPDPAVYQLACQRLGVAPHSALAFDDAPAGVLAACSAGVRCIGIASNGIRERLLKAGAEAVVPDFVSAEFQPFASVLLGNRDAELAA